MESKELSKYFKDIEERSKSQAIDAMMSKIHDRAHVAEEYSSYALVIDIKELEHIAEEVSKETAQGGSNNEHISR